MVSHFIMAIFSQWPSIHVLIVLILTGHYFDSVIPFDDVDYVYQQLMYEINLLEREPQWVPAKWVAPSVNSGGACS